MKRKRTYPLFVPKLKYMNKLFTFQVTQAQHEKLGLLASKSGKPMSAAAWLRKQIDQGEIK